MKRCFGPSVSTKNPTDPFSDLASMMKEFENTHYTKNLIDLTFNTDNCVCAQLLSEFARMLRNRYNDASGKSSILAVSEAQEKSIDSLACAAEYIAYAFDTITELDSECYEYHLVFERNDEDDRICTFKVDVEDGIFYEMLMGNFDKIPVRKEVSADGPY